jgi:hypothetical protein
MLRHREQRIYILAFTTLLRLSEETFHHPHLTSIRIRILGTFQFYAKSDPDMDTGLQLLTLAEESDFFKIFIHSTVNLYYFILLVKRHGCHNFQYFGKYIKIFLKKL